MSLLEKGASSEPHTCINAQCYPRPPTSLWAGRALCGPGPQRVGHPPPHLRLLPGQPLSLGQDLVGQHANTYLFNFKNIIKPAVLKMRVNGDGLQFHFTLIGTICCEQAAGMASSPPRGWPCPPSSSPRIRWG